MTSFRHAAAHKGRINLHVTVLEYFFLKDVMVVCSKSITSSSGTNCMMTLNISLQRIMDNLEQSSLYVGCLVWDKRIYQWNNDTINYSAKRMKLSKQWRWYVESLVPQPHFRTVQIVQVSFVAKTSNRLISLFPVSRRRTSSFWSNLEGIL